VSKTMGRGREGAEKQKEGREGKGERRRRFGKR
jgi:hypothetical protein